MEGECCREICKSLTGIALGYCWLESAHLWIGSDPGGEGGICMDTLPLLDADPGVPVRAAAVNGCEPRSDPPLPW